jgi:D-amino-acid oxidase
MKITVLGCGVIGLTSALRLQADGYPVTIRTWKIPPDTTSDKAAAFWSPYRIGEDPQTFSWIGETYQTLSDLAQIPHSGVSMIPLHKFLKDAGDLSDQWWLKAIPNGRFSPIPPEDLPPGYRAGWTVEVPLMETPIYLPFLMDRFCKAGGEIIAGEKITDVRTCHTPGVIVVNCTGLGSRDLVGDQSLVPVRGQIVVTDTPGVDSIYVDADNPPSYLVPREDGCIIGGTYESGAWEESSDPNTIASILERASGILPGLETGPVLRTYAGLRPYRPTVRLEVDPFSNWLVHHYGHGGAGFTLSWGAAGRLSEIVKGLL